MTYPRRHRSSAHRWHNSQNSAGERSQQYWQHRGDGVFENPYVRVDYSGSQVKVTVKNSAFRYTYSDPYVHVELK